MGTACAVCGLATAEPACPRCNTIVTPDRAICRKCGKRFLGPTAECDACGTAMDAAPAGPDEASAARALASVPGITEARAKALASRGFRDFADVVRLALPRPAVTKGLHHAIARRVLLSALGSPKRRVVIAATCPTCGTPWTQGTVRCPACGSVATVAVDLEAVERKLEEVTGEIVDLASDPDFLEMPEDVRRELLQAFGGMDEAELLREDSRRQIDAWREKGFDVGPLEGLLERDPSGFQERSVRLIRSQLLKKAEGHRFRCPLCELVLESVAEECPNCGARFA